MFALCAFLFFLSAGTSWSLPTKAARADCGITISNLDPEPIVVSDGDYQFIYAEPNVTTVLVTGGSNVVIACSGGNLTLSDATLLNSTIVATCEAGTQFTVGGDTLDFNDLVCSRIPFHTARYTGNSCEAGGKEIELGFILSDGTFARLLIICFDDVLRISLYSTYNLTRSIGHHESGVDRPSFIEDNFYGLGVTVNELYVHDNQKATVNTLIGLPANSTKYIHDGDDFYLARGHLTAKADFVYAPQQVATFHYVNAAPQWQSFNGFNWEQVEADLRDFAEANVLDLRVWTGTYGVSTLPHEETGEEIPLYLFVDENDNKALPVPELYWKVAYNPATLQGVALLGVNNPYPTNLNNSIICADISSSIGWLNWNASDIAAGYSYACEVDDFRQTVTYLPIFKVDSLLV